MTNQNYKPSFIPKYKQPTLSEMILEIIEEALDSEIFDVFLSGYAESYRKARQHLLNRDVKEKQKFQRQIRHNFYNQLYHLQKNGFVEKRSKKEGNFIWKLTKSGKKKLKELKQKINFPPRKKYQKEKDDKLKIIIFDIPEKEKFKREWLRQQLMFLGFAMLQKSVWAGKNKLPPEFLEDLEAIDLLKNIHIFRVSEEDRGTVII